VSAEAEAPAGFWRRYAAWSLDWLLVGLPLAIVLAPLLLKARSQFDAINASLQDFVYEHMVAAGGALPSPVAMAADLLRSEAMGGRLHTQLLALQGTLGLVAVVVLGAGALWFVGFEASPWQATPGKRLARVRVAAPDGARLPPARVLARHVAGALSWLLLNLGHAIAGWRADRRALHDLLAGAQLRARGPMPRWARWWLLAQGALLLSVLLGLLAWIAWLLWQLGTLV
jgi:uncharacterized RDD family membrane protein YckC